jgi:pyridoxamine 5'-phosphate oxidase
MAESRHLCAEDLGPDPIEQFHSWFEAAHDAGIAHPEAAAVASATPEGRPSCRMVLVKAVDERGFVFFTNYESRKGSELIANPYAALLFHWEAQERQVRVEGRVTQTSRDRSILYAHTRSRQSQLSALASAQSRPIDSREILEARVAEIDAAYPAGPLPVSEHWGGFRIEPERVEFWQGGVARLHDRFVYERSGGGWSITRLQP